MKKLKIASLFCGCGGTDIGALGNFMFQDIYYPGLNTEIIYANDIDEKACDIFDANFSIKTDRRDIRTIAEDEIPEHDVLLAGFPCQSFSILAQNPPRLGCKDEKGKLFFEIVRMLKYHNPKYFICENVKGILSANKGKTFPLIIDEFRRVGYNVFHKTLNSKYYGVPQKRERVFIVGIDKKLEAEYIFPEGILNDDNLVPLKKVVQKNVTGKYFFSERAVEGMLRANKASNAKMNKGRDQNLDEPCNTVTAHLAKVTLNGTDPVLKTGDRYRRFTPREVADIQSFPSNFKLTGSDNAQYKALGNAIPPVVFWHIMEELTFLDMSLCKMLGNSLEQVNSSVVKRTMET